MRENVTVKFTLAFDEDPRLTALFAMQAFLERTGGIMESISWEHVLVAVVLVAIAVYGVLVFRGSRKCFGILAGGGDFLALNPSDEAFMKEARRSGAAVCLVAVVIGASLLGQSIQDNEALRMACLAVVVASVAAIVLLVVLTMRMQFKLSEEWRERHR